MEAAADCSSSGSSSVLPPYSSSSWPDVRPDFTESSFFCPLDLLEQKPESVHMKETSNKNNTEFFMDHLQRCFVEDLAEVKARNVLEVSVQGPVCRIKWHLVVRLKVETNKLSLA